MSTPTIDLHAAATPPRPSQAGAHATLPRGGASNTVGSPERNLGHAQPSSLPRIRVFRGLTWLDDIVPLPHTLKGYLLFVLALTVICGLAIFQVWTSLRISQARGELAALRVQYSLIEQKNAELLWKIGQRTTLEQVQRRAVQLDFHPALKRNYISNTYNVEGAAPHAGVLPGNAPSSRIPPLSNVHRMESATDSSVAAQRIISPASDTLFPSRSVEADPEAPATGSDEPSPWSVTERFSIEEFAQLVSGWQQQASDSWQAGWQTVREWSEPLLEQASDFFMGQLKQP